MKLPRILTPSTWDWDALYARLQNFPVVNVKSLWLIVLDAVTLTWGWTLSYNTSGHGDPTVYNSWLIFLAGLHGFSLGGYIAKRNTSKDGNADEDTIPIVPPRDARLNEGREHG